MTTLITGAAGFLGSALTRTLEAERRPVVCLIRDWLRGGPQGYGKTLVFGDVTNPSVLRRTLADYEITEVYHLAAQAIVSQCAEDPVTALHVAVIGTANVLQAVRETGRPIKVVVSTSDKAFGHAPSPYTEETPLDPRYAYEASKACQDITARMFAYNFGVDVRVIRAVNIYGPGDPNESRLIPQTARRLLRGEAPLLHEGAAQMRRQYSYIDDAVSAFRTVMAKGAAGEVYCAGALDEPMTVRDMMQAMAHMVGVPWKGADVKARDERFVEIETQEVIDTKLRGLGWEPQTGIFVGLRKTINWYKENGERHDNVG